MSDQRTRLLPKPSHRAPPLPTSSGRPALMLFVAAVVLIVVGFGSWGWILRNNTDVLGLLAPDLSALTLSPDGTITDGTRRWQIEWEDAPGVYEGTVRWAVPWRDRDWPFFTHDVLLVNGDYADPDKVHITVSDHVTWAKWYGPEPEGDLAMVHAVTIDPAMYRQLMQVRPGQRVRARGREILSLSRLGDGGEKLSWRADTGCRTMLMTRLDILER